MSCDDPDATWCDDHRCYLEKCWHQGRECT